MFRWMILTLWALMAAPALAAVSGPVPGNVVTAELITAQDGVTGRTLSAGLRLTMEPGWKTYWRSPGEVGLPPALDWSESRGVEEAVLSYPAPERFEAFDIQNFGYGGEVVFPLAITLADGATSARLAVRADLLVCADICVPETVEVALDLGSGGGIDTASAQILSDWVARVPLGPEAGITLETVHLDADALTLTARSDVAFAVPDVFPEHGDYAAFDAPEIVLSDGGRALWAKLPVIAPGEGALDLTIVDGDRAATLRAEPGAVAPAPPGQGRALWWMLLVAFAGGVILNAMPCVLPVLSIKLAAALQARDRPLGRVRAGFLAAAAGAVAFFVALAGVVIALRAGGVAVGWGVQFQQPIFLAFVIGAMALFAANLLGFFEVSLGQGAMTGLARAEGRGGWGGDFATGAFAALMATPCSAPFIGTAVTYALTSGAAEVVAVFAAMGLGLAAPYLLVAARPGLVRRLPKPGRWMVHVKMALGGLLVLTAAWLVTVLAGSAGWQMAGTVAALAVALLAALALGRHVWVLGGTGLAALMLAAALIPQGDVAQAEMSGPWQAFDPDRIATEVAAGRVVFVDVTADWCLTCKANKRLVLDGDAAMAALSDTVALRADWTRPDAVIADYLRANDRFGIPFDAVYGPGAPGGIVLPELLTERAVLDAIAAAGAEPSG